MQLQAWDNVLSRRPTATDYVVAALLVAITVSAVAVAVLA